MLDPSRYTLFELAQELCLNPDPCTVCYARAVAMKAAPRASGPTETERRMNEPFRIMPTVVWTAVTVSAALAVVDHPGLFYPIVMGYAAAVMAYLMWRRSRRP